MSHWGQERDSGGMRMVAAAGGTGFPGCLGKDALTPCPLCQWAVLSIRPPDASGQGGMVAMVPSGCAALLQLSCFSG